MVYLTFDGLLVTFLFFFVISLLYIDIYEFTGRLSSLLGFPTSRAWTGDIGI